MDLKELVFYLVMDALFYFPPLKKSFFAIGMKIEGDKDKSMKSYTISNQLQVFCNRMKIVKFLCNKVFSVVKRIAK